MKHRIYLILSLLGLYTCSVNDYTQEMSEEEILITKIFSTEGRHLAFADLAFFKGKFFCTYRVAKSHVGDDGVVYLLGSNNSENWNFIRSFEVKGVDLRDPKFVLSEEEIVLYLHLGGSVFRNGVFVEHNQFVTNSHNGNVWEKLNLINIKDKWLWKPIIYSNSVLAAGYRAGEELILYKSKI